jgi:hypothetical protein
MWWACHFSFLMVCQLLDCCNVPFTTLSIICNLGNTCPLMVFLLPFCVKFHLCPSSCGPTIEFTKVMRCELLLGLLFADGSNFVTCKLEHIIIHRWATERTHHVLQGVSLAYRNFIGNVPTTMSNWLTPNIIYP